MYLNDGIATDSKANTDGDGSRITNLREWYGRRSKEFGSANYPKYRESKEAHANDAKEVSKMERRLELETESFRREFSGKLQLSLQSYRPGRKKNEHSTFVQAPLIKTNYYCYEPSDLLKPEDLLTFDESDNESSSPCSSTQSDDDLVVESKNTQKLESNETNSLSSTRTFDTTIPVSNVVEKCTTQVKEDSEIISPTPTNFLKWLNFYSSFNCILQKEIETFGEDQSKKELRVNISRTLAERINDCAKRNCSNKEIAALSNFLVDLFEGKPVESWREGEKFSLDIADRRQIFAAMNTICDRYIEQIKWDSELLEQIRLVIVIICTKQSQFYNVFCAKIVDSLALLSFDIDKIVSKVKSFGKESSQEAATHWISDEQSIFRLFCRVQMVLRPEAVEGKPHKTQGKSLLKMIFEEIVRSKPIPLCSPFVLLEILESYVKPLCMQKPEFKSKLVNVYIPLLKKNGILKRWDKQLPDEAKQGLDYNGELIIESRHEYLICQLNNSLIDLEKLSLTSIKS